MSDPTTRDLFPGGFFYLSIFILILSFAFIVLSQSVWDYDFWWHIATGRYIVETKSIPSADPFSFTSQLPENSNLYPERERFILSQYWLAQIIFFLLYKSSGAAGIVVLRTILHLSTLYIIYSALKGRGVAPHIIYPSLFLAILNLFRFFGDRPVLFTITFSVACLVIIDSYIRTRSKIFYFLPFLMLLWANMHGGFILGDVIILIYILTEGAKIILGRSGFSEKEKALFFLCLFLSLGASGINPNGFFALAIAFSNEYAPFYSGIQEYYSPFYLLKMKYTPPDYGYLTALFLLPVILLLRRRKFNPAHLAVLIFLAAASVSAARFTVYFGVLSSLIMGSELDLWMKEHHDKFIIKQTHLDIAFSIIMLVSSSLYLLAVANTDAFKMRESRWTVPKEAADFVEKNHVKGNMLNDMATGGYLAWRLYPRVKTFIDTRALNYTVMREYSWMATTAESAYQRSLPPGKTPLWRRLLNHYNINVIVFSPMDIFGSILPLVTKILDEDDWVPVSLNVMAIVFVRDIPENKEIIEKFRKSKEQVYNVMIVRTSMTAQTYRQNPQYLESLGDIFVKIGKKDDAVKAYKLALKRKPDNPGVKEKLDKLIEANTEVKK